MKKSFKTKNLRAIAMLVLISILATTGGTVVNAVTMIPSPKEMIYKGVNYKQYPGKDRYETAANVAVSEGAVGGTVVIARGDDFADALVSGSLGSPILLSRRKGIPESTLSAVMQLEPAKIIFVGGADVLPEDQVSLLKSKLTGANIVRLSGSDRYATAVAVAKYIDPSNKKDVIVARGDIFADALSAGTFLGKGNSVLLLTRPSSLPEETRSLLKSRKTVLLVGSEAAINANVQKNIETLTDNDVSRIGGRNRYETSVKVATHVYPAPSMQNISLVRGDVFADGVVSSFLATKFQGPVILTESLCKYIPTSIGSVRRIFVPGDALGKVEDCLPKVDDPKPPVVDPKPTDPVDPKPTDPKPPVDPTDPTPTDPTDPVDPTDPTDPPVDPDPTDPPVDPDPDPTDPTYSQYADPQVIALLPQFTELEEQLRPWNDEWLAGRFPMVPGGLVNSSYSYMKDYSSGPFLTDDEYAQEFGSLETAQRLLSNAEKAFVFANYYDSIEESINDSTSEGFGLIFDKAVKIYYDSDLYTEESYARFLIQYEKSRVVNNNLTENPLDYYDEETGFSSYPVYTNEQILVEQAALQVAIDQVELK